MDDISYEDFMRCMVRDMGKDSDPELRDAARAALAAVEWYLRLGISPPEGRWNVPVNNHNGDV